MGPRRDNARQFLKDDTDVRFEVKSRLRKGLGLPLLEKPAGLAKAEKPEKGAVVQMPEKKKA